MGPATNVVDAVAPVTEGEDAVLHLNVLPGPVLAVTGILNAVPLQETVAGAGELMTGAGLTFTTSVALLPIHPATDFGVTK